MWIKDKVCYGGGVKNKHPSVLNLKLLNTCSGQLVPVIN